MGVYIHGMEMPKDGFVEIIIKADGTVQQTGQTLRLAGDCFYTAYVGERPPMYKAFPVPPHCRMIDANALKKIVGDAKHMDAGVFDGKTMYSDHLCIGADYDDVCMAIDETPTIIPEYPAEEGEP